MGTPGPNDAHMKGESILPGLGEDEPTDAQRAGLRSKGAATLAAMKEKIEEAKAELSVQARAQQEREEAQLRRSAELDAREAKLVAAEKKAAKGTKPDDDPK